MNTVHNETTVIIHLNTDDQKTEFIHHIYLFHKDFVLLIIHKYVIVDVKNLMDIIENVKEPYLFLKTVVKIVQNDKV